MVAYLLYAAAALYLGVLTSISPCPLATNIAAISYVGRKVGDSRSVMVAGLLYTLGRCLLYLGLAALLAATAMSIPAVSVFLQKYMHLALGPVVFVAWHVPGRANHHGPRWCGHDRRNAEAGRYDGSLGRMLLGILFAVSFCPTSAAWFFGLLALIMGSEAGAITTLLARIGISLPTAYCPEARSSCLSSTASAPRCRCYWLHFSWPIAPSRSARLTTCWRKSSGGQGRSPVGYSCSPASISV